LSGPAGGNGITSSSVLADPRETLALIDNADLGLTSLDGQTLEANSIVIRRALLGDGNLDDVVDALDFDIWFKHVGVATFSTAAGDFDHSGVVDALDFDVWFKHVGEAGLPVTAGILEANAAAGVPEPASLALIAPAAAMLLHRRWRRGRGM
jgi:hypothetical protein